MRRRRRPCQYGVFRLACGAPSDTKRRRPDGSTWDLCSRHAAVVDRIRANVEAHRDLLGRLESG